MKNVMDSDIEIEINNAEEQLRQAMLASDVEALDRLLAPDLIFTNHFGQCLGKDADLAAHKSGALSISQLEPSEQQVKLVGGNVAVVSVRVQVAGRYAGQPAGGNFDLRGSGLAHQMTIGRSWQLTPAQLPDNLQHAGGHYAASLLRAGAFARPAITVLQK